MDDDWSAPVLPVRLDPRGVDGPTRGQAAGPRWRQTTHGFHVPASVSDHPPAQRILEQSMRLGPGGAVSGWASLYLHGGSTFTGLATDGVSRLPILLVSPDRQLRRSPGSVACFDSIPKQDRLRRHGIWITCPERAVFDEMRRHDFHGAVEVIDMAAYCELTSLRRMGCYLSSWPRRRDCAHVQVALGYADEHSRSGQESRTRTVWTRDAGFDPPLCNRPLFDLDGRLLGVPDLLDPVLGIVGEYDGADHRRRDRRFGDLTREELMRSHGLEYFTVVGAHLQDRPALVRRFAAVRERAAASLDIRRPLWTLVPPAHWRPFAWQTNLDDRLAQSERRSGRPPSPYAVQVS